MGYNEQKLYVITMDGEAEFAYENKEDAEDKLQELYDQQREIISEEEGYEGKQLEEVLAVEFEYILEEIDLSDELWEDAYKVYTKMDDEDEFFIDDDDEDEFFIDDDDEDEE